MKTQTKALIASLIVVALGLSAVSGVTYSWWSDSDNGEISVTTGVLKVETSVISVTDGVSNIDSLSGLLNKPVSNNISISGYAPSGSSNDLEIVYEAKFYNTMDARAYIGFYGKSVPNGSSFEMKIESQALSNLQPNDSFGISAKSNGSCEVVTVKLIFTDMQQNGEYKVNLRNEVYQANMPEGDTWDGVPSQLDEYLFEVGDGKYSIQTAAELATFAKMVNEDGNNFQNKTVYLTNDINLDNKEWTPIGKSGNSSIAAFSGTFDGMGHTIMNLKVTQVATEEDSIAGLFGNLMGSVKDLTIENAEIKHYTKPGIDGDGNYSTNSGTAVLAGSWYQSTGDQFITGVTVRGNVSVEGLKYVGAITGYISNPDSLSIITDCSVVGSGSDHISLKAVPQEKPDNSSNDNGDKVGGIVGYCGTRVSISDCTVSGVSIGGFRDLGGIVGCVSGGSSEVRSCTVLESEITVSNENSYENTQYTTQGSRNADTFVGRILDGFSFDPNSCSGTISKTYPDGISP